MATEFISNSWLMPENSNQDKLANYSLSFDGTSTNIEATKLGLTTTISVSAWVKTTTTSGTRIIVNEDDWGSNRNWHLYIAGSNKVLFRVYGASGQIAFIIRATAGEITDGNWHHVCATWDGTTNTNGIQLSIDNDIETATATGTGINTDNVDLAIGSASNSASTNNIDGSITEVSIFDYALSSSQVTQLYGTGSAVGNPMSLATKPVAYYPLGRSPFNGEFLATNKATELFENYSLNFDGTDDHISVSSVSLGTTQSISFWIKRDSTSSQSVPIGDTASGWVGIRVYMNGTTLYLRVGTTIVNFGSILTDTSNWTHICITRNAGSTSVYLNGSFNNTQSISDSTASISVDSIGGNTVYNKYVSGMMSNVSLFTSELTSAQVTTLYNSGKPSNLSTFAVTPVSWWRLGSVNSSFDGTNWTVLDEIGTSNGTSANMTQADLVDGVGATGNGVSSGMSSGTNKVGNSPYSENNAVSYGMSILAKSTSTPT